MVKTREGGGSSERGWFEKMVMRKVGDGANTLFCYDCQVGGVPFSVHFRLLFDLAVDKSTTIRNIFCLGQGKEGKLGFGGGGCGCGRRRC